MNISREMRDWIEIHIDKDKITDTARVCCVWDASGQWVDVDYQYDPLTGADDYLLVFGNPSDEGNVSEETWNEALAVGEYLKGLLSIPLVTDRI